MSNSNKATESVSEPTPLTSFASRLDTICYRLLEVETSTKNIATRLLGDIDISGPESACPGEPKGEYNLLSHVINELAERLEAMERLTSVMQDRL